MTRRFGLYAGANALALIWTLFAVTRPWVGTIAEDPQRELVQRTLPFALVVAALVTALVALSLPDARRDAFLRRHFALYLAAPALLFLLSRGGGVTTQHLGAVYLFAIAAWTAHATLGLWHVVANLADRRAALTLAAVLLVPYFALRPYHNSTIPTASDEPHYLIIMQSLVIDHDLDLTNNYDGEAYREFYPDRLPDRHVIQVGPWQYPIRDLGLPLIGALPFAAAGRAGVVALMGLVAAALAAQLYLACRELRIAHRPALVGTALACLSHPILSYTTQIYPELLSALAFVSAARLVRARRGATNLALAGAAACVGVLPWLSTRAALIALGVGLVVAYCALRAVAPATLSQRAIRVAAAAVPFFALLAALSFVNWQLFGRFMPGAAYYLVSDQQQVLTYAPQVGALGLLFDRTFGLIPHAPVYLLGALGVLPLWRRGPSALLAALFLGWLVAFVFIASIAYWWADGAPPSRYILAGLPFFAVLLAAGLERVEGLRAVAWRALAAGLAAFSLFIAYVYAVLPNIRYDLAVDIRLTERDGQLFEFVGRLARPDPADAFPSIVRATPVDLALGILWLAVLVALIASARRVPAVETR
ncbi:MAG TPA: hypothetical protein VGQ86_01930 [Candidatus Limnocylindria bacterium]|nr:hypothetical protein [Candidatus Limnocylindria bacterium]